MKKTLAFALICSLLLPQIASAGPRNCSFYPLQNKIKTARNAEDIEKLINKKYNFNLKFPCGGSVLQLAILRGNPNVLDVLLSKGNVNPFAIVSNTDFPIKGAPREIPISFFAAYYAQRPEILKLFLDYCGDTIYQKDKNGQNILWYLDQNPVLSNTDIYDQVAENLMIFDSQRANERERMERTNSPLNMGEKNNNNNNENSPQYNNQNQHNAPGIIEEEAGQAFNANDALKESNMNGDF